MFNGESVTSTHSRTSILVQCTAALLGGHYYTYAISTGSIFVFKTRTIVTLA